VQVGQPGHLYGAEGVLVLEKPTGPVTRAQGDVHPLGNPHYWLDPYNGRVIAQHIADRMSQLDPANKAGYQQRADAFVRSIDNAMFGSANVGSLGADKLWAWSNAGNLAQQMRAAGKALAGWSAKMEPLRGKPIVEYHPVYVYFAHRFGLNVIDHLEPKPGIAPTPAHIAEVMREMTAQNCKVIMQPPFYSTAAANTVKSRTQATVLVTPASVGQAPTAKDYISLIDTIVDQLSGAFN
jgi:ABC-type Zn uptake system ZnuABC Zn-binding protein ZnuA